VVVSLFGMLLTTVFLFREQQRKDEYLEVRPHQEAPMLAEYSFQTEQAV